MQTLPNPDIAERTVGEIVADDYRLGSVFKRYGIDFCCGGGRTVAEACSKQGVAVDDLREALVAARSTEDGHSKGDERQWPLGFLVDYITNVHHRFVREHLPILTQFATKVAKVHGDANPELHEVADLVRDLSSELTEHLADEEATLFPYVKQLVVAETQKVRPTRPVFDTAKNPITSMERDHDGAGAIMKRLRAITANYRPPPHACNTYRALFATLEQFEEDLHRHVHLENNVLFPRALALEAELLSD